MKEVGAYKTINPAVLIIAVNAGESVASVIYRYTMKYACSASQKIKASRYDTTHAVASQS